MAKTEEDRKRKDEGKVQLSSSLSKKNRGDEKRKESASLEFDVHLNPLYSDLKEQLKACFNDNSPEGQVKACPDGVQMITHPFKCMIFENFIDDQDFLEKLKLELDQELNYYPKNNDLYRFRQSDDFKNYDLPYVNGLKKCFRSEGFELMQGMTGFDLFQDQIDLTASKYEYNDVLLCHDDQLEERRIAFILYLVPKWAESDGGKLDMFDKDEHGQPNQVVKSIIPKWNTFVCFEVTPHSYHQVSEILSQEKIRLSVNGWFRGPPKPDDSNPYLEDFEGIVKYNDHNVDEDALKTWISETYLEIDTQIQIQEEFKDTSELNLPDFLREEMYEEVSQLLVNQESQLEWIPKGPPNLRSYDCLRIESAPDMIKQFVTVLTSEAMFLTVSNLSGLKLHPLVPEDNDEEEEEEEKEDDDVVEINKSDGGSNGKPAKEERVVREKKKKREKVSDPRCTAEIRRWRKGCYTLVHDHDPDVRDEEAKLDFMIHFNHDFETNREHGGFVSYIAKNEDDELLAVEPQSNHMSLVYRDGETARFVKYLNDAHSEVFFDVSLVFQE